MEQKLSRAKASTIHQFFFKQSALPLFGLLRIVLVLYTCYQSFRFYKTLSGLSTYGEAFNDIHQPGGLLRFLQVPFPIPDGWTLTVAVVYYLSAFLAAIGLFTRPALFVFSILTIYFCDITFSRGFFDHEASLSTQILLIMALAPGATSFSLDRLVNWYRYRQTKGNTLWNAIIGSPVPVWGYKLVLIILAVTYITAGVSKIRYGGWQWLDGNTLTHYLDGTASPYTEGKKPMFITPPDVNESDKWKDGFGIYSYSYGNRQSNAGWRDIGHKISQNIHLVSFISITTVIFECLGFFVLMNGWWRFLYLAGAIIMHKTIGVLMNLPFVSYQTVCLLMIDWKWVVSKLPPRLRRKLTAPIVLLRNKLSV